MVEPENPEHTSVWPRLLLEKGIVAGPAHKGKSRPHAAVLLESVDTAESDENSGGEQQ
jgi:hypothetical protein